MPMRRTFLVFLGLLLTTAFAAADEPCRPRSAPGVAWYARPSESPHDLGYYVGGGAWKRGDPPAPDEGTWGWDYGGLLLPRRVVLLWHHGRRSQGGPGAYRTVGTTRRNSSSP
jgi:hypothetical protein